MRNKRFDDEETNVLGNEEREKGKTSEEDYFEETAAEVAPRLGTFTDVPSISPENERPTATEAPRNIEETTVEAGRGMAILALAISVISLFIMPVILGAAGVIIGFIAKRRGAEGLGNWAIGIGAVSLIVSLFIAPFFL